MKAFIEIQDQGLSLFPYKLCTLTPVFLILTNNIFLRIKLFLSSFFAIYPTGKSSTIRFSLFTENK